MCIPYVFVCASRYAHGSCISACMLECEQHKRKRESAVKRQRKTEGREMNTQFQRDKQMRKGEGGGGMAMGSEVARLLKVT